MAEWSNAPDSKSGLGKPNGGSNPSLSAIFLLSDPAYLFGSILFSAVGFAAFVYGKRLAHWKPLVLGIALMAYPYFVSQTWAVYAVGVVLSVLIFLLRD